MIRKLKSAHSILREEGAIELLSRLRLRAGRNLAGNSLSSIFPVMAYYNHPEGERIPLYAGYRDFMKPLHCIAHTDAEGYKLFCRDNAQNYLGTTRLGGALQFYHFITRDLHLDIKGKRILDVGCGDGAFAYVLAAHGAAEVDAIDTDFSYRQLNPQHQDLLREAVRDLPVMADQKMEDLERRVRIFEGDIQRIQIQEQYDIVMSLTVLEHVFDLRAGLKAMCDLLKPGGLMIHRFNPYFSETGGHEFGILDFPWGHVRLSREEIALYLGTYRAWEKDQTLDILDQAFNSPKLTLNEIDTLFGTLGLTILHASESRAFSWKPDSSQEDILKQCRRNYPAITCFPPAQKEIVLQNIINWDRNVTSRTILFLVIFDRSPAKGVFLCASVDPLGWD
jgi:2-polyprenyl-3-methyl-5-hydroxy-6-metoxy-1,4-benzoquinol methylase